MKYIAIVIILLLMSGCAVVSDTTLRQDLEASIRDGFGDQARMPDVVHKSR